MISFSFILIFFSFFNSSFGVYSFFNASSEIIGSNKEFFEKFLVSTDGIIGEGSSQASLAETLDILTPFAPCTLHEVPVEVPLPSDPRFKYWPIQVIQPRCMGGCSLHKWSCRASRVEKVKVRLVKLKMENSVFEPSGTIETEVEAHKDCECSCKIRPSDCIPGKHEYNKETCSCFCMQRLNCPYGMEFDEDTCSCKCKNILSCGSSEVFDENNCRCKLIGPESAFCAEGQLDLTRLCPTKSCQFPMKISLGPDPCICTF